MIDELKKGRFERIGLFCLNILSVNVMNYPEMLGMCIGNFNSLELLFRIYLCKRLGEPTDGFDLNEGQLVKETSLTNYFQFRELANAYNKFSDVKIESKTIDDIVRFRDALAHGRITASKESFPLVVIKFDRPKNGFAMVAIKQELSEQYLSEIKIKIRNCVDVVQRQIDNM